MTALPPLPPPDIWVREDFGLGDSTVHQGYTAEQVEAIRRETVEACALVCVIHSQYPIENDYDRGYDAARKKAAAALRALLEKQP